MCICKRQCLHQLCKYSQTTDYKCEVYLFLLLETRLCTKLIARHITRRRIRDAPYSPAEIIEPLSNYVSPRLKLCLEAKAISRSLCEVWAEKSTVLLIFVVLEKLLSDLQSLKSVFGISVHITFWSPLCQCFIFYIFFITNRSMCDSPMFFFFSLLFLVKQRMCRKNENFLHSLLTRLSWIRRYCVFFLIAVVGPCLWILIF